MKTTRDFLASGRELLPDIKPEEQPIQIPADFPDELVTLIRNKLSVKKFQLFSQTCTYWYRHFNLQRLEAARSTENFEEQESILVTLLLNNSVFFTEDSREDISNWVNYLKKIHTPRDQRVKDGHSFAQLLAKSLAMAINPNTTMRDWNEFERWLSAYDNYSNSLLPLLSIKAIVAHAVGASYSPPNMTLHQLMDHSQVCIDSLSKARLVLGVCQLQEKFNLTSLNTKLLHVDKYKTYDSSIRNFLFVLEALSHKMDWKDIYSLLFDIWNNYDIGFGTNLFQLLNLLVLCYRSSAEMRSWVLTTAVAVDKLHGKQQDFFNRFTSHLIALSFEDDKSRVEWLKKDMTPLLFHTNLPKLVCAGLSNDAARKEAIFALLSLPAGFDNENLWRQTIAKLILFVIGNTHSHEVQLELTEVAYNNPYYTNWMPIRYSYESTEFEEEYACFASGNPYCKDKLWNYFQYSKNISPELIDYWVQKFESLMYNLKNINKTDNPQYIRSMIATFHDILPKKNDPERWKAWSEMLYELISENDDNELGAFFGWQYLESFPTCSKVSEKLLRYLLEDLYKEMQKGNSVNKIISRCILLIPKLSDELRDFFENFPLFDFIYNYSDEIVKNRAVIGLLPHLSDVLLNLLPVMDEQIVPPRLQTISYCSLL